MSGYRVSLFALLLLASCAHAGQFVPCCNFTDVVVAMNNASNLGDITMASGAWVVGSPGIFLPNTGHPVTITGAPGLATTVNSRGFFAFYVWGFTSTLTLVNLAITPAGVSSNDTFALSILDSQVTLVNSKVYGFFCGTVLCPYAACGARSAVSVNGTSNFSVVGSTFSTNGAPLTFGGAITTIAAASRIAIRNSTFLTSAAPGGTIRLTAGSAGNTIYNSSFVSNTGGGAIVVSQASSLDIQSSVFDNNSGTSGTISIVSAAFVSVKSSTFQNNNGGGALFLQAAQASVDNTTFTNNYASFSPNLAAAITMYGGTVDIRSTVFVKSSGGGGSYGAIYAAASGLTSSVNVYNSTFTQNTTPGCGAAISLVSPLLSATIRDSYFGAMQSTASTTPPVCANGIDSLTVSSSIFVDNSAQSQGSSIYFSSSTAGVLSIDRSIFSRNTVTNPGLSAGTVAFSGVSLQISNSYFSANTIQGSPGHGAALSISFGSAQVVNTTFYNHSLPNSCGGAVATATTKPVTFVNCTYQRNAGTCGGAIYGWNLASTMLIQSCMFDNNNATSGNGGAIEFAIDANLTICGATAFTRGYASISGAYIDTSVGLSSFVTIQPGATFVGGRSGSNGGAIALQASNTVAFVSGANFTNNVALSGGAIFMSPGKSLSIDGSVFIQNKAAAGTGGAINYLNALALSLSNTQFNANMATSHGLALYGGFPPGAPAMNVSGCSFISHQGGAATWLTVASANGVGGPPLFLTDTLFSDNTATLTLIPMLFANIHYMRGCTFNGNTANHYVVLSSAYPENGDFLPPAMQINSTVFCYNIGQYSILFSAQGVGGVGTVPITLFNVSAMINTNTNSNGVFFGKIASVVNCTMSQASAWVSGGAIASNYNGTMTIAGSTFIHNYAGTNGGAVWGLPGTTVMSITGSTFDHQNGGLYGGAIYGVVAFVSNSTFTANSAGTGGAIYHMAATSTNISNTVFACNYVTNDGGAVYFASTATLTLSTCLFTANLAASIAGTYGGAVWVHTTATLMSYNSNFIENMADQDSGGAIYAGTATISGGSFVSNSAFGPQLGRGNGGALWVTKNVTLSGVTFTQNSATYYGGAVYGSVATITNCTFFQNSVTQSGAIGGAVMNNGTAAMTLLGVTFYQNSATYYGGAVYGSVAAMTNCTFFKNSVTGAGSIGGAVMNTGTAVLTLINSTFQSNTAQGLLPGGQVFTSGGVYVDGCSFLGLQTHLASGAAIAMNFPATIRNSIFSGMTSLSGASGLFYTGTGAGTLYISGAQFDNNGVGLLNIGNGTVWAAANLQQNLSVVNSTFSSNTAIACGGVFYASSITVAGSTFIDNQAVSTLPTMPYRGGAIYVYGSGSSAIINSTFIGNSASQGGAIEFGFESGGASSVNVTGSLFTMNSASSPCPFTTCYGGAVHIMAGRATIDSSTFSQNSAWHGGALVVGSLTAPVSYGLVTITRSAFTQNRAPNFGATSLFVLDGSNVDGCAFVGNSAATSGGAGRIQGNSANVTRISLSNSVFTGNTAVSSAGGVYLGLVNATFTANTFTGNSASGATSQGGAVYMLSIPIFRDYGSVYGNNKAAMGGAVYDTAGVYGQLRQIDTVAFRDNKATTCGGAFYSSMPGIFVNTTFNVAACMFTGNQAPNGGALHTADVGTSRVSLTSCVFRSNSASLRGGAVYTGRLGDAGSSFQNNTAVLDGGAIRITQAGSVTTSGATFSSNSAGQTGGAISFGVQASITVSGATFVANSAFNGGALFIDYVAAYGSLSNVNFTANNASGSGGAIYLSEANADTFAINSGSLFERNTASVLGGALYLAGCSSVQNTILRSNEAPAGAAIETLDMLTVSSTVQFLGNTAMMSAAGIRCDGCTLSLYAQLEFSQYIIFDSNAAPDFPVFTCSAGSKISSFYGATLTNNPSNRRDGQVADCSQCGCCNVQPQVIFTEECVPAPSVLYPDNTCQVACQPGYQVVADNVTCTDGPIFSPGPAVCAPIACPPLSTIKPANSNPLTANDYVPDVNHTTTGNHFTVVCNNGFYLVGNASIWCFGPNWNSTVPACIPKPCNISDAVVMHGHIVPGSYFVGDDIPVACDAGYVLSGSLPRCSPFTTHVETATTCMAILCPPLPPLTDQLNVTIQSPGQTGDTASYRCNAGYQLYGGDEVVTCTGYAWNGTTPICLRSACPRLDPNRDGDIGNGTVVYTFYGNTSGTPVTGDSAYCYCDPGFALQGYANDGENYRACAQAPLWTGTCTCLVTACTVTEGAFVNTSGTFAVNESVSVRCRPGSAGQDTGGAVSACQQAGLNVQAKFVPLLIACGECPANYWSPGDVANCRMCPGGGTTNNTGAIAQSECICAQGYYEQTPYEGDCIKCEDGAFCPGGHERPRAGEGFWQAGGQYLACTPAEACAGNNTCHVGYTGTYCGDCSPHFYRLNGRCLACPTDIAWRLVIVILVGLGIAYGLVLIVRPSDISERSYGFASGTIALSFIQIVATFADLNVKWPITTRQMFDIFSTLNLNLELAGPECFATFTFWQKFQLQMSIPLIVFGLLLILWVGWSLVTWLKLKRPPLVIIKRRASDIGKIAYGAYLFFLTMAYLLLAKYTLTVFACKKRAGDVYSLASAPTELCYEPPWGDNAIIGGIGIALYIVGIPIFIHVVYYRVRSKSGAHVATRSLYSNFLVKKYNEKRWYWEAVTMLRKLAVVVVTTLFEGDAFIQVALCSAVFFLSCLLTLVWKPYRWSKHNALEIISLVGSLIVLFCGQMSGSPDYGPAQQEGLGIIAIITVAICLACFGAIFVLETGIFCSISRLSRRIHEGNGDLKCPSATSQPVSTLLYGDSIVVAGVDGLVRAHNAEDLSPSLSMPLGHRAKCAGMYGPHLAVAANNQMEIWDLTSRAIMLVGDLPSDVTCLASSSRGAVVGTDDGQLTCFLFNTEPVAKGALPTTSNDHKTLSAEELEEALEGEAVNALSSFNADSKRSFKTVKRITDVRTIAAHEGPIGAVCLAGSFAYSVGADGVARKWSTKDARCVRDFKFATGSTRVTATAVVENGVNLFVGDTRGFIHVIDLATSQVVRRLRGQTLDVAALHVTNPDCDHTLVSASLDGTVLLWDTDRLTYLQTITRQDSPVVAATCSKDGNRVFYATRKGLLYAHEVKREWHMRDFDPYVGRMLFDKCVRRIKGALGVIGDGEKGQQPYEELQLMSRDLGVTDEEFTAASPSAVGDGHSSDMWAQLRPGSAAAVALALQGQTLAREGKSL